MTNKVPRFRINTSCIKGIKLTYKSKVGSKGCRMRGMTEYQDVEKEVEKEARREASRAGAASESESGAGAIEEYPTRRTRHAVPKCPRASATHGEPSPKKVRKGSEIVVSVQMPEIIPYGTEEYKEEE